MINLKQKICYCLIGFLALIITACGGASGSPGNSPTNVVQLGSLPNGSNVFISSASYTAGSNSSTTGTLSIGGGSSGESWVLINIHS